MNNFNVLVTGRLKSALQTIVTYIREHSDFQVNVKVVTNGHFDPLNGLTETPDALILVLSQHYKDELDSLSGRSPSSRPSTIAIHAKNDMDIMRMAMKAGARDFLSEPVSLEAIIESLNQIKSEKDLSDDKCNIISVINSKGGCGASFIACNLACALTASRKTSLIDLNIQFGGQALYLDLSPIRSIVEAMQSVKDLDTQALDGYMTKHDSGLKLLAAPSNRVALHDEVSANDLNSLLSVMKTSYSAIVIDLPFILDSLSIVAMSRSNKIIIVGQQNLVSVREVSRLIKVMQQDLEVPKDRIVIAINRYEAKSVISTEEIEGIEIVTIPNDYSNAKKSVDHGVPVITLAPRSKSSIALNDLANKLIGVQIKQKRRLFASLFSN